MKAHLEVERKYEVGADASVPRLTALPKVAAVEDPRELALESVYFDTQGHDLMRVGVTLRRRTGGDDEGWHLKLPAGAGDREELHQPLQRRSAVTTVPRALRSLVQVHVRGRKLVPVATLRNRRVVYRLLSKDGTVLAEFCDDNVTATLPALDGSVTSSSWREWEVELVEGSRKLLDAADDLAVTAGARPAAATSKLARVLDEPASDRAGFVEAKPSKRGPAGTVVLSHLQDQVHTLKSFDPGVRRDQPDSVHKMRVATRRLRSALATFEPLLDPHAGDALRAELKWLAGVLGEARDAEVMRDRLTTMATEDAAGADNDASDPAEAAGDLSSELEARYRTAHAEVLRVLSSARYFRLLDSLDTLLASPPWASVAEERAGKVLPRLVRRDWRRVKKRAAATEHAPTTAEQDVALHELRKASKRLRYSCEALEPVFGEPARELGAGAKELQEVLGEHQDSVVSRELLQQLAAEAGLPGESALVLGRLQLLEQQHAQRSRAHYEVAWSSVAHRRHRRWLTS
jgi:CHAD domain-containing protein